MLLTVLIVLIVLALLGGGVGYSRYGFGGFSPLGVILAIVLILWLVGYLRV
jgi:hypothetical protein